MLLSIDRVRLVGQLAAAAADLKAAGSAINKIKAAGEVRTILAKLGTEPASPLIGIRIDLTNKEASIRSIREYLSIGIKSVPDELRPFEQKMVVQIASTLGDRETVNRASIFEQ